MDHDTVGEGARASLEAIDARAALGEARRLLAEGDAGRARRWATAVVDLGSDLSTWLGAASVLARSLEDAPLERARRVAILGSATTSQLATLLPLGCARAGLQIEVYEAPYGQYRQEILDPTSSLYAFEPDVVVLAVHDGDVDLPLISPDPEDALQRAASEFTRLWEVLASRSRATVVQFTIAIPPEQALGHVGLSVPGSRQRLLAELNLRLPLDAPSSVLFLDCARIAAEIGTRTWFDARYWHLAKQPVSPRCIPVLARHLGAVIAADAGLSRKCLVLDLDNTLWGGVLGEDGLEGIAIGDGPDGEAFSAFQEHVKALESRGILLAICSKNDDALVRQAFDHHRRMVLRLEDFAVISASWDDKPSQLRRIASDLGLGLDALVFVDDNPLERESVRQMLPEVDVIAMPPDPAGYVRAVADYPYFEVARLTDEDSLRTTQYRARAAAATARVEAATLEEFLDSLEMEATVEPIDAANAPRVTQLVGKTNQFNLTSRRRTEAEILDLAADPDVVALAARLRDRFTDHGLVGVVLARRDGTALDIDTWLMSCRVIGRTLEQALLTTLSAAARSMGCSSIRGTYIPSAKNTLVADLYPRLGFTPAPLDHRDPTREPGTTRWTIAVDELAVDSHVRVVDATTRPREDCSARRAVDPDHL